MNKRSLHAYVCVPPISLGHANLREQLGNVVVIQSPSVVSGHSAPRISLTHPQSSEHVSCEPSDVTVLCQGCHSLLPHPL